MNSHDAPLGPQELVLLTPEEMNLADQKAIGRGIRGVDLMEAAGQAVAMAISATWSKRWVVVLCGPGNNGGDGFVTARHLAAAGWTVRLALLGNLEGLKGDAAHHAGLWTGAIEPFSADILDGAELVVDAIFGAGLSRPLEGAARSMVEALKAGHIPICAIDVPSGLDGASGLIRGDAAPAEQTVPFFRKKPGHLLFPGRALCGRLVVLDIGIPQEVLGEIAAKTFENGPGLWLGRFPWPSTEGYKYTRGHALILGGEAITGAARLTAHGALRAGAGLVTLAAPPVAWPIYATALMSAMVRSVEGVEGWRELLKDERKNAIAIGPGAGVGGSTRQYALEALATRRALVLDANALSSFAEAPDTLFQAIDGPCVLTPHEGEFARLFTFKGDKLDHARHAAAQSGAVMLLKGPDTVIAAPDGRAVINTNAPPQLATGGSGDVLTGIVVGLLAQGVDPFWAASIAAWMHGEAATTSGLGLIAEDLPEAMPSVIQGLRKLSV